MKIFTVRSIFMVLFLLSGAIMVSLLPVVWLRVMLLIIILSAIVLIQFLYQNKMNRKLHQLVKMEDNHSVGLVDENTLTGPVFKGIIEMKKKLVKNIFESQLAGAQITSVSHQLTVTMEEYNTLSRQLFCEAADIKELSSESRDVIGNTIKEVKDIVLLLDNVKGTLNEMQHDSKRSKESVEQSLSEILGVTESISLVQASSGKTVESMDRVSKTAAEVTSILDAVDNIAKQTHLLSLNASIESARAGEAGRGFSVVAEEIRKLSENSNIAVKSIANLVERIMHEIKELRNTVVVEWQNVNKSVALSKKIENNLAHIQASFNDAQNNIERIIKVSEKEFLLLSTINHSVSNLETVIGEVTTGVDDICETIRSQKQKVDEVDELRSRLAEASNNLSLLNEKSDLHVLEKNRERFNKIAHEVIGLLNQKAFQDDVFYHMNMQEHQRILDELLFSFGCIEAIWSNDAKGRFIYSNPPAGIANAGIRDWFAESMNQKQYISRIYISAITRNPCITVSVPIIHPSGACIGVLGADLKLEI